MSEIVMELRTYIFIPLLLTLLIEIPYCYFIMQYKSVLNIISINCFTNVSFNTVLLLIGRFFYYGETFYLYDMNTMIPLLISGVYFVVELIIYLIESSFYIKTNKYSLRNSTIYLHTFIANLITAILGVIISLFIL